MTGFPIVVFVLGLLFFLSACQDPGPEPIFGAPYEIVINETGGSPDAPPRITGDWLMLTVSYAGGCADHEFSLESYMRRDTAHVWLNHLDHGDSCEALIIDDLSVELPTGVLSMRVIAMHDPSGDYPHFLKW